MDLLVDLQWIGHRPGNLLAQEGGKLLSQPVDKCLDCANANLKLIGYLFVRRYDLDTAGSQKRLQRPQSGLFSTGGVFVLASSRWVRGDGGGGTRVGLEKEPLRNRGHTQKRLFFSTG